MKYVILFITIIFFPSCSFDNKTGIWNNEINNVKNKNLFKDFEKLSSSNESFNKVVSFDKNFKLNITKPISSSKWRDIYFDSTNNFPHFKYNNGNKLKYKTNKLSNSNLDNHIFFIDKHIITSDFKGNIFIFSIEEDKLISKFNFYKKKYKNIKKYLNLIVYKDVVYVSDNIGFLYALNFKTNKILWAKNHKIPFRSNLKVYKDKLIVANQNNKLFFINRNNGEVLRLIPTEETLIKNNFVNNLSSNNIFTFFLNTYGSLYAVNNSSMEIEWFLNLNRSVNLNASNLFFGSKVISNNNLVIVSSDKFTYVIDAKNGNVLQKKNFSSIIKPILIGNQLFLISKNNLLISTNLIDGKIIFSYDINEEIKKFLNLKKKKKVVFREIFFVNEKIFVFLFNSYLLKFNINGNLENVSKLPQKINSNIIFVDSSMLFINTRKKISIIN